jgi:hypothetical protein
MSQKVQSYLLITLLSLLVLASCLSALTNGSIPPSQPGESEPADVDDNPTQTDTISEMIPPAEFFTVMGLSPGQALSMFQDHSTDSTIINHIPSTGSSLSPTSNVLSVDGSNWIQVDFEGQTGWVDFSFLAQQYGSLPEDLIRLGQEVLSALRSSQYQQLVDLVHPELCLSFSPYSYLHPERQIFCRTELENGSKSADLLLWGYYDGSGEPIYLSFKEYHEKFVYDQDYFHAPIIGFDTEVSSGNSINNIQEVFPNGMMIEYNFPGFDPQYGGMDWRSIRLVFVQMGSDWYLTAIIHGEWTI